MYLIIGIWGGANRIYATIKFVLYTLVGSLLMLVAILATAFAYQAGHGGSWVGRLRLRGAARLRRDRRLRRRRSSSLAFLAFFLAFAIKVPMFPFHTWLPDAHVEAPTAGSVILAAVLLKLGGYGFIRFALPLFPDAAQTFAPAIIVLCLIAIIYGAIVALVQPDLKKLVAYSSVSHMGFVTLGIFVFTSRACRARSSRWSTTASSPAPCSCSSASSTSGPTTGRSPRWAGWRRGRRSTPRSSGSSCSPRPGCPGLSGFVGEFLVLVGTFAVNPCAAADRHVRDDPRRRLPAVDVPARRLRRAVRLPARASATT